MKIKLLLLVMAINFANAQNYSWSKGIGSTGTDQGLGIATDASGNVYTTGHFSGTVDFDPGPGTSNLTGSGTFISKFDGAGNFIWARNVGSPSSNGWGIAVDASGGVYVGGTFSGNGDFDPGPGVYTLTNTVSDNIFICKLDAGGNFSWAVSIGGGGNTERCFALTLDAFANVYTTGYFSGTTDFNPGPGVFNLNTPGNSCAFVCKLNSSGTFLWAGKLGGGQDLGVSITTDANGNVYTAGTFGVTGDFDPGGGVYTLTGGGGFICKLTSSGGFLWARQLGTSNNVQIGSSKADPNGNVFTAGTYNGTTDFDPGSGVFNLTGTGNFSSKLDMNGNFVWAAGYPLNMMFPTGAAVNGVDNNGNVLVAGTFTGTVDFDPGPAVFNLTSTGIGMFIVKFNASGIPLWGKNIDGSVSGRSVYIDASGNVHLTGSFSGSVDFDPGPSSTIHASSVTDIFMLKLCATPDAPLAINGNSVVCENSSQSFSVSLIPGSTSYSWSLPNGWSGVSSSNNINTIAGSASGNVSVSAVNSCGASSPQVYSVTVNSAPILQSTASHSAICAGESITLTASGADTYTWSGGVNNGVAFSPTATSTYSLSGTNTITGCKSISLNTINISVNPTPTISIASSSSVFCSGMTVTLTANGANSYTWNGLNFGVTNIVNPLSTTVYTVQGTNTMNCSSMASYTLQPNLAAAFNYTVSGMTASLSLSGGCNSFIWDYGNGTGSAINNNPVVSYQAPGVYGICLKCDGLPGLCTQCVNLQFPGNLIGGVGLTEIKTIASIQIYPNPNDGRFTINNSDASGNASIVLINALGQKVFEETLSPGENLIKTELPKGIYLYCVIADNNRIKEGKLMIQ